MWITGYADRPFSLRLISLARCSNCDAAIEMKTGTPNVQ